MKIQSINSIETSALCNFKCEYCPHSSGLKRKTGLMDLPTFKQAIKVTKYFRSKPYFKQNRLPIEVHDINLHWMGEPLLNPLIYDFTTYAVKELPNVKFRLCTNCSLLNEARLLQLKKSGLSYLDITDHTASDTARAVMLKDKWHIDGNVSRDFCSRPHNWADQVNWYKWDWSPICTHLDYGSVVITWDGKIVTCCIDANVTHVLGTIWDDNLDDIEIKPIELCKQCHYSIPKPKEA